MKNTSGTKQEILNLAISLFATRGYAETTMRDLAAVLGIKAASIYSHFTSKEEILVAICDLGTGKLRGVMQQVEKISDSRERFQTYIQRHLQGILIDDPNIVEIYMKYWKIADEATGGKFEAFNHEYWGFVASLFRDLFPKLKELPCYAHHATPVFFISTLNSIPKYVDAGNIDIEMISRDLYNRFVYGFSKSGTIQKP